MLPFALKGTPRGLHGNVHVAVRGFVDGGDDRFIMRVNSIEGLLLDPRDELVVNKAACCLARDWQAGMKHAGSNQNIQSRRLLISKAGGLDGLVQSHDGDVMDTGWLVG